MKFCNGLVIFVSLATLLAFAGLIPLGPWHDEYFTLHNYHQQGIGYLFARLLHWSPRPLSEALSYLYGMAVYHFGSPLIGLFVASFWILLVAAMLLPGLQGTRRFLAPSVMLAMLLLGHPVAEVFYWPFGVVAYLPTLAAVVMLLALDWSGRIGSVAADAWIFVALMMAAASSEVGALFTAIYIVLLIATRSLGSRRQGVILAVPMMLSLTVLYLQYTGRVADSNEVFGDPSVAHHPMMTLLAVAKHLLFELLKGDKAQHTYMTLVTGLATKLMFMLGIYLVMSAHQGQPDQRAQRMRLNLTIASLATATLVMAAALYNFGSLCCERHDTMRQGYVMVALASMATYGAMRWPSRHRRFAGPALLFALLIPLATAIPKLTAEYRNYASKRQASEKTWQSGQASGPEMQITQTVPGPITGGLYIEPGIYQPVPAARDDVHWMLTFFGKKSAVVAAPVGISGSSDQAHHETGG